MTIKEAIRERHSVRQYKDVAIKAEDKERLEAVIKECNAESGLHLQLICDEPECFDTLFAHYGKFTNAKNYIAIVGPKSKDDLDELGGYYGERLVLEAQMIGLNTCWVAGSYGKGKCKAAVAEGEKLVCVISIGYGEKTGHAHRSKPEDKLCNVPESARPDWFKEGLEAALLAKASLPNVPIYVDAAGCAGVTPASHNTALEAMKMCHIHVR